MLDRLDRREFPARSDVEFTVEFRNELLNPLRQQLVFAFFRRQVGHGRNDRLHVIGDTELIEFVGRPITWQAEPRQAFPPAALRFVPSPLGQLQFVDRLFKSLAGRDGADIGRPALEHLFELFESLVVVRNMARQFRFGRLDVVACLLSFVRQHFELLSRFGKFLFGRTFEQYLHSGGDDPTGKAEERDRPSELRGRSPEEPSEDERHADDERHAEPRENLGRQELLFEQLFRFTCQCFAIPHDTIEALPQLLVPPELLQFPALRAVR